MWRGGGEGRGVAVSHRHPGLKDRGACHEIRIKTVNVVIQGGQLGLLGGRRVDQGEVIQAGL